MATIPLATMRVTLGEYYKKRGWHSLKVSRMPDNQVVAIYWRYASQGFPVPKKEYEQLCFF